jgi:hypothetical protein
MVFSSWQPIVLQPQQLHGAAGPTTTPLQSPYADNLSLTRAPCVLLQPHGNHMDYIPGHYHYHEGNHYNGW